MLIKSKGHRFSAQLHAKMVAYLMSDKGRATDQAWSFFHNLTSFEEKGIVQEFLANDGFRKQRKNGVALQHIILSFHELDDPHITPAILEGLTQKFLELYVPKGIAFARVHEAEAHPHVHILIGANELGSDRSIRISRSKFLEIHRQLEEYQREHYPELSHSLVKIRGKNREKEKPLSEQELRMKDKLGIRPTKKQLLKQQLQGLLVEANSVSEFYNLMETNGFELYSYRQKIRGFLKDGKKFRFSTIGVSEQMIRELMTEHEKRMEMISNARSERTISRGLGR